MKLRCNVDYPRMASLTMQSMQENLENVTLQVTALAALTKPGAKKLNMKSFPKQRNHCKEVLQRRK